MTQANQQFESNRDGERVLDGAGTKFGLFVPLFSGLRSGGFI